MDTLICTFNVFICLTLFSEVSKLYSMVVLERQYLLSGVDLGSCHFLFYFERIPYLVCLYWFCFLSLFWGLSLPPLYLLLYFLFLFPVLQFSWIISLCFCVSLSFSEWMIQNSADRGVHVLSRRSLKPLRMYCVHTTKGLQTHGTQISSKCGQKSDLSNVTSMHLGG